MSNIRRERFKRIAEARTTKIISMIRLLSNCSNKSAYQFAPDEVRKIFAAIESELKAARSRFSNGKKETKFTLD